MKRTAVISLVAILSAAMLYTIPTKAELIYPPHEDPAAAESPMDAFSFLTCYTDIFTLMSLRMYANATMLIGQLEFVHVPEDLKYIIQKYNNLTLELTEILDHLDKLLNEASILLYQFRLNETSQMLSEAGMHVGKAEILLNEVEEATVTLGERFGIFAAPAESKTKEAYNTLQGILERLKQLIEDYLKLLQSIRDETSEIIREDLKPTTLTLLLNTTKVFVGELVESSGILIADGESLSDRRITLLLDGNTVSSAITDFDGSYHTTMVIPYKYVRDMTAKALYAPQGADRGVYLASLSSPTSIEVMFNETKLETAAPDEAYPGLPITVRGNVTSEGGTPSNQRGVRLFFDNSLLGCAETDYQGSFQIEATLKPEVPTGKHTVTIAIDPKGVYAGVSQDRAVNIVKIPSEITLHVPSLTILPAKMYVEGNVSSASSPLQGASVILQLGDNFTIAKTSENGEFSVTIDMPLSLIFAGFQQLKVTVEPAEPWHAATHAEASIFVMNPTNLGLTSAAFISTGAVIYTKQTKAKKREERRVSGVALLPSDRYLPTIFPSQSEAKFEGLKGRIIEAYVKASETVERATAAPMKPQMTLREFLWETKPNLNAAAEAFAELTILAERALYSSHASTENEAVKAEDLASSISQSLGITGLLRVGVT